jgi:hypothetical protein
VALQLAGLGFFAREMNAGWAEWQAQGLPTETGRAPAGALVPAPPI